MPRIDLKNRRPVNSAIKISLYDKLKELSDTTKVPMSRLLDMAVELLLEHYNKS